MNPAQRLTTAADTIERTATAATYGAWRVTGEPFEPQVWSDNAIETIADGATVQDAAHVALWDPPTARLAATLLRTLAGYATEAEHLGLTVEHGPLTTAALNLADTINTQATT